VSAAKGAPPVQFVPVDHVALVLPFHVTIAASAETEPKPEIAATAAVSKAERRKKRDVVMDTLS
jgi:hypothetical protein